MQRRKLIEEQRRIVDKLHMIETVLIPYRPKGRPSKLPQELQAQLRRLNHMINPDLGARLDREGVERLKALQQRTRMMRRL